MLARFLRPFSLFVPSFRLPYPRSNGELTVPRWYDIHLSNFTGTALLNRIAWMDCSRLSPCYDWTFDAIDLKPGKMDHHEIGYVCNNFVMDGNDGLGVCHPSNSTLETDAGGTL